MTLEEQKAEMQERAKRAESRVYDVMREEGCEFLLPVTYERGPEAWLRAVAKIRIVALPKKD